MVGQDPAAATEAPKGRRARKRLETRQRLFEAALRLIEERGYEAVSVGEITAAAGTAKGTFFNHFPTKAHLLAAWYEDVLQPKAGLGGGALPDVLVALARDRMAAIEAVPALLAAKIAHEGDPAIIAAERRLDKAIETLLVERLRQDTALPLPAEELAALCLAVMTGAARSWRYAEEKGGLSEFAARRLRALGTLIQAAGD